jgi:hypothetical protein
MKKIIPLCISVMVMATACNNSSSTGKKVDTQTQATGDSTKNAVYQCPMDCEKGKTYAQPGKCPVCEMDLEKK